MWSFSSPARHEELRGAGAACQLASHPSSAGGAQGRTAVAEPPGARLPQAALRREVPLDDGPGQVGRARLGQLCAPQDVHVQALWVVAAERAAAAGALEPARCGTPDLVHWRGEGGSGKQDQQATDRAQSKCRAGRTSFAVLCVHPIPMHGGLVDVQQPCAAVDVVAREVAVDAGGCRSPIATRWCARRRHGDRR